MPPGTMPLLTSLYSADFDGSPSNTSRKRLRNRVRPASSSGNSRAGKQAHVAHGIERSLRVDVERLDRLDLVVEEVDAIRQRRAHREEVDEAAAHAELARRDDLRDVRVAGQRELRAQCVDVERLRLAQEERERRKVRGRREPVQRGGRRYDQQIAFAARHVIQRGEPLGHEVLVRRELVVRQRFPIGEQRHANVRCEPRHFFGEALRGARLRAHDRHHALLRRRATCEVGQRERVRGARERSRPHALSRIGHVVDQGRDRDRCGRFQGRISVGIQARNYTDGVTTPTLASRWFGIAAPRGGAFALGAALHAKVKAILGAPWPRAAPLLTCS